VTEHDSNPQMHESRMECGVCWWVYDPANGDASREVEPGTAFGSLPGDWSCPECGSAKSKFLPLEAGRVDVATRLRAALERIGETKIRGLAVFNERLQVATVGFAADDPARLGVVVTPWAMNAVVLSSEQHALSGQKVGDTINVALPSGVYPFVVQEIEGFGAIAACSLFSTMTDFVDQEAAAAAAEAALAELRAPAEEVA
jgi:[NiFe] hydrogenase assembly HybE family chaperone